MMSLVSALVSLNPLTVGLGFVGLLCILLWHNNDQTNTPPGPFKWPILGSVPTLVVSVFFHKEQVHELLTRLSLKYGKIFCFYVGSMRYTVLNDANIIKEAFQKQELAGRPRFLFDTIVGNKGGDLLNGDTWTQHRKFTLSVFRNAGVSTSSFDRKITNEADSLRKAIENLNGKSFSPKSLFMNAAANVICTIILGKQFGYMSQDEGFRQLLRAIPLRPQIVRKISLLRSIRVPIIRNILLNRYGGEFRECYGQTTSFVRNLVEEHKETFKEKSSCRDFIDLYFQEKQDQDKADFCDEYLVLLTDVIFGAATESSSNTLGWCLFRLIEYPDYQQRIRDEINASCSDDRLPSYHDKVTMPFTEAFLLEIQRLYSLVPLAVPHMANKSTTLRGYTIPEGSMVLSNLWAVHHDPNLWEDPYEFKPTRFLAKDGTVIKRDELIPFGSGRLMCLGEKIARMEMFIFLTHLVSHFNFKRADNHSPLGKTLTLTNAPPEFYVTAQTLA